QVGKNEIVVKKSFGVLSLFLSQFTSIVNGVLFAAAIFSFVISDRLDGFFILVTLFLNATVGFIQEYRAEKSIAKLKHFVTPLCRVIRDGLEKQIPTTELVPGDIVILSEGDRIPADGRLIARYPIEIDEAVLTGESLPVVKEKDPVYLGTLVIKGHAHLVVEKTGMQTRFG